VDNSGGISASLAGRYATALFALAQEKKAVATVEASMQNLQQALTESPEFAALTTNGGVPRAAAKAAVAGVAKALKLDPLSSPLVRDQCSRCRFWRACNKFSRRSDRQRRQRPGIVCGTAKGAFGPIEKARRQRREN
jgi:ATP synthase delta (OSCP) subunit